jgi:acyl carrier protein
MPDTLERLRTVVEKIAARPVPADAGESLFESGLLDSFLLPDLIGAIEEEFSIKIPDSDLTPRKFDSLSRMEAYLAK